MGETKINSLGGVKNMADDGCGTFKVFSNTGRATVDITGNPVIEEPAFTEETETQEAEQPPVHSALAESVE